MCIVVVKFNSQHNAQLINSKNDALEENIRLGAEMNKTFNTNIIQDNKENYDYS